MNKISIVMRSRNDAEFAERTIRAILAQDYPDFELLAFDNASSDGTREIIAKFPQIKIFDVPEGTYVPGKVLNEAVSHCSGVVVVFNNADAIVRDSQWLRNLTAPIFSGEAAATFARQLARPDADPWVRLDYARSFSPRRRFSDTFFSMASSAASAEVLRKHPFDDKIKFSEDVFWTRDLVKSGLVIKYVPDAVVEHSHNYTDDQLARRFSGEGEADARIYGTGTSVFSLVKGIIAAVLRDFMYLSSTGKYSDILKSARHRMTQKYSYFTARNEAAKKYAKAAK